MFDDGISVAIAERDEGGGTESSSIIHKRFFNQLARLPPQPISLSRSFPFQKAISRQK
jgi:hypothetical protein